MYPRLSYRVRIRIESELCLIDTVRGSDRIGFAIQSTRTNSNITAPEFRVIDENGKNLGVMQRDAALALAREKRLDLIEIAPTAKPPVARIMNFDKFRYFEEKKRRKSYAAERGQGSKQIQISGRTAKNDLDIRLRKIEDFLGRGHQVTIVLTLRGREKGHKDWAFQKLKEFLAMIPVPYQMVSEPRVGGRGIVLTINKK